MKLRAVFFDAGTISRKGIIRLLEELKSRNLKLVIISNDSSPKEFYEEILKERGISSYFELRVWQAEVKIKSMIFHEAFGRLDGISPGESIFIGEKYERDIKNASKLGFRVIWLNRRKKKIREFPLGPFGWEVKEISEISKIISSLG